MWTVELHRLGLELIGLWPKTNEAAKDNYASDLRLGITFIIITFVSGIPLVCAFTRVRNDMILVIDNLQITLPLMLVSLKLVIIRWKRTGMCLEFSLNVKRLYNFAFLTFKLHIYIVLKLENYIEELKNIGESHLNLKKKNIL